MIFWGITRSGDRLLLGGPAEVSLSRERDAPADLLRAVFPADHLWAELREVTVCKEGETLFRGIVDEQNTTLSAAGLKVELVCRSREALLLDNEAPPGTLTAPSLSQLETKLLTPIGLALGVGDKGRKQGSLTVKKGESCWTALARFCADFLGTVPRVDPDGLVQCGETLKKTVELAEVISAKLRLLPYLRLSEVWQQSCRGGYDTRYRDPLQTVPRRRYVSMESGKDPRKLLAAGQRNSRMLTVVCKGAWWPDRNDLASVTVPGLGRFEDCPVREVLYRLDGSGEQTRLTLEPGPGPEGGERECG